jgi:hypothetical protein
VTFDDELISRLQALASRPIDPEVETAHASMMAAVPAASGRARFRVALAGGTLVVAMLGGTGIAAAAGNLPAPVQDAAHVALAKVGVDVPRGTPRSTEGCDGKTYKNHGQFVRSQPKGEARAAAAKSPCGKPLVSQDGDDGGDDAEATENETKAPKSQADKAQNDKSQAPESPGQSGDDHGKPESESPGKDSAPGQAKKSSD